MEQAESPKSRGPIFILGIAERFGTNYLRDLLTLHPDCVKSRAPIWEDWMLSRSDLLFEYANSLERRWKMAWEAEGTKEELLKYLGHALIAFLSEGVVGRIVTKTPSVKGLSRFFELFEDVYLLIIVRDGSVVESKLRTFGGSRDRWIWQWSWAAQQILTFDRSESHDGRYLIVRYEDLLSDMETELKKVFRYLDLDVTGFDFKAATELPVRGSSDLKETEGKVHWQPVRRDVDFDPRDRWRTWSDREHERFNWVAGKYLEEFGYQPVRVKSRTLKILQYIRDGITEALELKRSIAVRSRARALFERASTSRR